MVCEHFAAKIATIVPEARTLETRGHDESGVENSGICRAVQNGPDEGDASEVGHLPGSFAG